MSVFKVCYAVLKVSYIIELKAKLAGLPSMDVRFLLVLLALLRTESLKWVVIPLGDIIRLGLPVPVTRVEARNLSSLSESSSSELLQEPIVFLAVALPLVSYCK